MEIIAKTSVRMAPRKVRLIADYIRKLSIDQALSYLSVSDKRGAIPLRKSIESAVANAVNNNKLNKDDLIIKAIEVLEAPAYKRFHPSTRGRIHPYKRRGSHVKIVLGVKEKIQSGIKEKVLKQRRKGEKNGTES
jgi:large subunit ribosomal protein L22